MTNLIDSNVLAQLGISPGNNGGGQGQGVLAALNGQGQGNGAFIDLIVAKLQSDGVTAEQLKALQEQNGTNDTLSAIIAGLNASEGTEIIEAAEIAAQEQSAALDASLEHALINVQTAALPTDADGAPLGIEISADTPITSDLIAQLNQIEPGAAGLDTSGEQPITTVSVDADSAQTIPAHLNTLTSAQGSAQTASSAASDTPPLTSPLNVKASSPASPIAGQDTAETITSAEDALSIPLSELSAAQAELRAELDANGQGAVTDSASLSAFGAPITSQLAVYGGNAAKQDGGKQGTSKATVLGAAPQNGNGSSQPSQSSPSNAPQNGANVTTAASALPQLQGANAPAGGADSSPLPFGTDALAAGFNGEFDTVDGEIFQSLKQDSQLAAKTNAKPGAAPAGYKGHYAQAPTATKATVLNMTKGADNSIERVSMQLEPADLGRIDIELKMAKDGSLKAAISTDKIETLNSLQRDSGALQKALAEAGIETGSDSFTFDLRDQNNGQLAQDARDGNSALFDLGHLDDMPADAMSDMAVVMQNMSAYGETYLRPDGVNIFV